MTTDSPATGPDLLVFNGVDGASGQYLVPPMYPNDISDVARGIVVDESQARELRWWQQRSIEASFGPKEGVDPLKLEEAGWGVIFAFEADPSIRAALAPLLEHRRRSAARTNETYYRELVYRPGESKQQFLARYGAAPGPADPDNVPYYLLIVGSPQDIPFSLQYQLDVQYAVGRLHFDTLEGYANYARSVVAAETDGSGRGRQVAFFGAQNPDDRATQLSTEELVVPVAAHARDAFSDWQVTPFVGPDATKDRLASLLGSSGGPAVVFTATHGVGFPSGHEQQERDQGGLLCQDWPGPLAWTQPLNPQHYFGARDVGDDMRLLGLICFHFACFGAGTPQFDDFSSAGAGPRRELTPRPFVAGLPKRLLGHPGGGALAAIGHVDRAWGYSFVWPQAGRQSQVYEGCMTRLLEGHPVGWAFEYFNERYAELASDLTLVLEDIKYGKSPDHLELAGLWTAHNDARAFAILGDPAVRLPGIADDARKALSSSTAAATPTAVSAPPSIGADNRPPPLAVEAPPSAFPPAAPEPAPAKPAPVEPSSAAPDPSSAAPDLRLGAPPPPPAVTPAGPSAAVDYGLFGDTAKAVREKLHAALERVGERLSDALERAVESITVLEVATYVSADPASSVYDPETHNFGPGAELKAFTRLTLTGDAVLLVPERSESVDDGLWAFHIGMVEQARANQHELLSALALAVTGLLDAVTGL
jgi:hypothetical protein